MRIAEGSRDEAGRWRPDDPDAYPPMDVHGTLPWSVLRADSVGWRARKLWWVQRGVDDAAPRVHASSMAATGRHGRISGGVSRFDPHLAEVLLTWCCPPGGMVLDPFAGGPVRGLVAGHLGYGYTGIDLLGGQVAANRERAEVWHAQGLLARMPVWEHAAAQDLLPTLPDASADCVLTCPPYHNLERYSQDPRDLSAMRWAEFEGVYRGIVGESVRVLRADRFGVWVVGDVRDSRGHLRGLPALTADAIRQAGAHVVNDLILVTASGTLAKLMRPAWSAARTVTRVHQYVVMFAKGDRRAAARAAQGGTAC